MKCEIVERSDYFEYDEFLKKTNSTFYNSSKYLRLLEKTLKSKLKFIELEKDNEIVATLPYLTKNSKFGKIINSSPFFGSYGGVISKEIEFKKNILEKFNDIQKESDILSSVIIENPFDKNNEIYKKYLNYNFIDSRFAQCTKLEQNNIEFAKKFDKRVRWSIRKADKNNIIVKKVPLDQKTILDFFNLHKENMESKNAQFKKLSFFEQVKNIFDFGKDYDVYVGLRENIPISYLLVFYFNGFTEYYMPAQNTEFRDLQSSSKLIFESINDSIDKNIKFYNFGGTPKNNHSLYRFKQGWNSVDFKYNYYISADIQRIKELDIEELKKLFQNFYILPYNVIKNE